jgi:hypothetical protein
LSRLGSRTHAGWIAVLTIRSLKDGRLDLVYYLDLGLSAADRFPLWTFH